MAFALKLGGMPRVGKQQQQQQQASTASASRQAGHGLRLASQQQQRRTVQHSARRLRVAAIEQPSTYQPEEQQPQASSGVEALAAHDPSELEAQLEVAELDAAQEDLLKWMLFLDGEQQEKDLDEAEDMEEVGDEEFEELYDEVEGMLEETEASFKAGDKVYGTVYEVDDDGAYVEIGAKSAGFVPLVECSLGKLKTVSPDAWKCAGRHARVNARGGTRGHGVEEEVVCRRRRRRRAAAAARSGAATPNSNRARRAAPRRRLQRAARCALRIGRGCAAATDAAACNLAALT